MRVSLPGGTGNSRSRPSSHPFSAYPLVRPRIGYFHVFKNLPILLPPASRHPDFFSRFPQIFLAPRAVGLFPVVETNEFAEALSR